MAHPGGRPTKYLPEYCEDAYKLCLLGATDKELADFFDVNEDTIHEWKLVYPKFSESLKEGKVKADSKVAEKLHSRAMGYEWDEIVPIKVKEVKYKDGRRVSEKENIVLTTVHKVVPPDATSALFWLKNRKSSVWRDKQEIDHTTNGKDLPTPILQGIQPKE